MKKYENKLDEVAKSLPPGKAIRIVSKGGDED